MQTIHRWVALHAPGPALKITGPRLQANGTPLNPQPGPSCIREALDQLRSLTDCSTTETPPDG